MVDNSLDILSIQGAVHRALLAVLAEDVMHCYRSYMVRGDTEFGKYKYIGKYKASLAHLTLH